MQITTDALVAEIAAAEPATIRVFHQHQIEFCCGGRIPLSEACARRGLDTTALLGELRAAQEGADGETDWRQAPLSGLIAHIQARYHGPLRDELPRLSSMMRKVVSRHGDSRPEIRHLQLTFEGLCRELLDHMAKEDSALFPAVLALEGTGQVPGTGWTWLDQPLAELEAEHDAAGAELARMRAITNGYTPPDDACPTFRGLYFGLAQLERDMHRHVHLENHVLFPRARRLADRRPASSASGL